MFLYQHWFIDGIAVTLFTALVVWIGVTGWRLIREFRARRPNDAWRILGAAGPAAIAILALILGPIDIDKIGELGGNFGIPKSVAKKAQKEAGK